MPAAIEAAGAQLLFLPPYSLDFSPIEMAFSKLKTLLFKAAERTVEGLWSAIGRLIDPVTPDSSLQQDTTRINPKKRTS